jgi:hypothetical protein
VLLSPTSTSFSPPPPHCFFLTIAAFLLTAVLPLDHDEEDEDARLSGDEDSDEA